jgi:menaquinone-dependent protoporphyrinogen oxidase
MSKIVIVYGTGEGQTAKIARYIAELAEKHGFDAEALDCQCQDVPGDAVPGEIAAVFVGASIHAGQYEEALRRWATAHRAVLESRVSAFFSVSLTSADKEDPPSRERAEQYVSTFVAETGWQPHKVGLFGGALRYTHYDDSTRALLRGIAERSGKPTDTTRDHEFTDWQTVIRFTEAVLADAGGQV